MGLTSLQVCTDTSDWLQGAGGDEYGVDSSSPSSDMLTCSRPLMERRLRPQQDQALNCPRCDSTHTKFCYYNNYSLSQPRYFCKTCRRYWTKGGTLRNIPVGGGCRKNRKITKKPSPSSSALSHNNNQTDLHLSFSDHHHQMQFNNLMGGTIGNVNPNFIDQNMGLIDQQHPKPIDFMEGCMTNFDNMGLGPNFHGFGSLEGNNSSSSSIALMDTCQRLMLPYYNYSINGHEEDDDDMKPNPNVLSIEWQDQQVKESNYGLINSMGSWTSGGIINGYGSTTTSHPLV